MNPVLASTLSRLLAAAALLGAAEAAALPESDFERLRERASPVDSLARFLERYVGGCTPGAERARCLEKARRARAEMTGRSFHVVLDDRAARAVRAHGYDPQTRSFRFELTPFFDANGLALTEGSPSGTDARGGVLLPIIPVDAPLPPDWLPMDMERLVRTQNLRLELVFQPLGVWSLPVRGGGRIEGVRAVFQGLRLVHARTGEPIAVRLQPGGRAR